MNPENNVRHLLDRQAIQDVLDEYCLRLEVNPFEQWLELFTEDTVYEVYRKTLNGRKELADLLSKAPHGIHIGGPARVEINDDRAETVQNYTFHGEDDKYSNKGWYYRTLVRTDEGWKISHTRVEFMKPTSSG